MIPDQLPDQIGVELAVVALGALLGIGLLLTAARRRRRA